MLSIIKVYVLSLFSTLYVESYNSDSSGLTLNINFEKNKCGTIIFSNHHMKTQISCGINFKKQYIKLNEINIMYEKQKLIINSLKGENLIKVKCSQNIYTLLEDYIRLHK
jgi:hypothetical protein